MLGVRDEENKVFTACANLWQSHPGSSTILVLLLMCAMATEGSFIMMQWDELLR